MNIRLSSRNLLGPGILCAGILPLLIYPMVAPAEACIAAAKCAAAATRAAVAGAPHRRVAGRTQARGGTGD